MDWLKTNEDGDVELVSEELKLYPVLQALNTLNYNKGPKDHDGRKKYRLKNELTYVYLMYSSRSPYKDYSEKERAEESRRDCGFTEDWKPSKELEAVIEKYIGTSPNKVQRLLKTTERFIDKFEAHLNNVDLNERNGAGGLVHKPTEIMATLERLPRLAETLFELETQARLGQISKLSSKGDHELGWSVVNGKQRDFRVGSRTLSEDGEEGDGEVQ